MAQVREPYTVVGYLAERTPLTSLLGLKKKEGEEWTAWDVCEGVCLFVVCSVFVV